MPQVAASPPPPPPSFPLHHQPPSPAGFVKVSLCKCAPALVFDCILQQLQLALCTPPLPSSSFLCADSSSLSWRLEKLGLMKLQMHVGFSIMYQVRAPPLSPSPPPPSPPRQALSQLLLQCPAIFTDVRLSGFASKRAAPAPAAGCGMLCKLLSGPGGLLPHCSGAATFSLSVFHTGVVQINACNGATQRHAQLLANRLHAFFSFFRSQLEPPCACVADGSRRKRPPPAWAQLHPTKRTAKKLAALPPQPA
jgi:hypothetical protein